MQSLLFLVTRKIAVKKRFALTCCLILFARISPAFAADILYIYNWNNYLSDKTIARFEAYCKCHLIQDFYGDNEEMLAKLAAGAKGYDIVVPTGFALQPLIAQNKLLPLDKKRLPGFKNINSVYLNESYDFGSRYSIPYALTTTVLGYNETELKKLGLLGKANDWGLLFDPAVLSKIKGRVTVLDSQRELISAALMYLGKSANSTNPADWRAAEAVILRAKPYWAAFNSQSYIKELTVGNIWLALGYSSDMYQAKIDVKNARRKFNVDFSLQRQGNTLSIDSFVILKDAPRKDLAYKFIEFMLNGQNAADVTNELGCGNPNQSALPYILPLMLKERPIFPTRADLQRLQQLEALTIKERRQLNKVWSEVKLK